MSDQKLGVLSEIQPGMSISYLTCVLVRIVGHLSPHESSPALAGWQ